MADGDPTDGSPPTSGALPGAGLPPGIVAGGGGAPPQTGNLPPSGAPAQRPVAKLGLEARGAEVCRGALQALTLAFPMVGASSKLGHAVMKAIQALSKELPQPNEGGDGQAQLMAAMQRAQMRQGAGGPPGAGGAPPPAMPQQPGPIPQMAA